MLIVISGGSLLGLANPRSLGSHPQNLSCDHQLRRLAHSHRCHLNGLGRGHSLHANIRSVQVADELQTKGSDYGNLLARLLVSLLLSAKKDVKRTIYTDPNSAVSSHPQSASTTSTSTHPSKATQTESSQVSPSPLPSFLPPSHLPHFPSTAFN